MRRFIQTNPFSNYTPSVSSAPTYGQSAMTNNYGALSNSGYSRPQADPNQMLGILQMLQQMQNRQQAPAAAAEPEKEMSDYRKYFAMKENKPTFVSLFGANNRTTPLQKSPAMLAAEAQYRDRYNASPQAAAYNAKVQALIDSGVPLGYGNAISRSGPVAAASAAKAQQNESKPDKEMSDYRKYFAMKENKPTFVSLFGRNNRTTPLQKSPAMLAAEAQYRDRYNASPEARAYNAKVDALRASGLNIGYGAPIKRGY